MRNPFTVIGKQKKANKPLLFSIGLIFLFLIPYAIINHLPVERKTIPFILGEELIPFLPSTLIIYLSAFIQFPLVIKRMSPFLLRKTVLVLSGAVAAGLVMFLLIPIRFPRELYRSENTLIHYFQKIDADGNCFPSLHILTTIIFSYCYTWTEQSRLKQSLMWFWSALIILSVLTTKQHYLLDVFGGIALAIPTIYVLKRHIISSAPVAKVGDE